MTLHFYLITFVLVVKNLKAIFGGRNVKIVSHNTFRDSLQLHHLDFIPQIGYFDRFSKELEIVRELEISDFSSSLMNRKQFGYVLHKQKDEYLIWNITAKEYVYAIIHETIPLYSYVEFSYKYL